MDSPYRPGVGARPAVFAGRGQQVQRASGLLAMVANSGEAAPAPLVVIGPRGLGKTVLLHVIRDQARAAGFATAHVAFDRRPGNHRALASTVVDDAHLRDSSDDSVWTRIRDRLTGLSIEVNASVLKVTSPASDARTPPTPTDRKHLAGLLIEAGQAITSDGKPGLALFIDEVHEAPTDDLQTLATALQDLIQTPHTPVVVFMAGLPETPETLIGANSFAERFDYLALPRLGDDAAHEVLLQPALNLGVRWSVPALDEVLRLAAGNPFMLQKLGHESWLAAAPTRPGDTITLDHVHAGYDATATGLAHGMFRGRWAKATPVEQALLTAMAAVVDADGNVATADLVTLTGRTTPQWSTARRSLIDKGLIEPAGHGVLRFTMPTFPDFVRDLTGLDHTTPAPATITTPPEHPQLEQRPDPTQHP